MNRARVEVLLRELAEELGLAVISADDGRATPAPQPRRRVEPTPEAHAKAARLLRRAGVYPREDRRR